MNIKRNALPAAIIIGFEENGLGVARALKNEKIPSIAIAEPGRHAAKKTNTCEKIIVLTEWTKESLLESLLNLGKEMQSKCPILITKDEAVLWISEAKEKLSSYYHIDIPNHDTINLLMSKEAFGQRAEKENWPVPLTLYISDRKSLNNKLNEIVYPIILKPAVKNNEFRNKGFKKAYQIDNEKELLEVYEMISPYEKEVVIQEWIQGPDSQIGFCLTYCAEGGEPLVIFPGRKLRQWPVYCGNTALSSPALEGWIEPMTEICKSIWKKVGYVGLGSVEFKIRPGSNEPVIMEPTVGRTNYQNEVAVVNGINIPAIAYYHSLKIPYENKKTNYINDPVKLVDGRREFYAARIYMQKKELTLRSWLEDRMGRKKYVLFRINDPVPFIYSVIKFYLHKLKNIFSL